MVWAGGLGPVPSVAGVYIKILAPGIHLDTGKTSRYRTN